MANITAGPMTTATATRSRLSWDREAIARYSLRDGGTDPDEALVERIGRGDGAAVQALVARKLPRMLALARRMLGDPIEAEDVAQDVFMRVWKQAPSWRPGAAGRSRGSAPPGASRCRSGPRRRR